MQPASHAHELNQVTSRAFKFIVQSHLWTAGGQASLTLLSAEVLGASRQAAALVFCFSLFVYNLDHLADRRPQTQWRRASRPLGALLCLLGFCASALCVLSAPAAVSAALMAPLLIGCLYGIPALPWRGALLRLRDLPAIKAPMVAATIAWCGVQVPLAFSPEADAQIALPLALHLTLFALSNCLLCDLRDIEEDARSATQTLPVLFGERPVRLALVLLNLALFVSLLAPWWPLEALPRLALAAGALGNAACAAYLGRGNRDWEYATLVDGCPYLLLLSLL